MRGFERKPPGDFITCVEPGAGWSALVFDIGQARILLPKEIARDSVIYVRTLISHPMHTGLFRDAEGNPIAAHWIQEVVVTYGGQRVARFEWTTGVSRDPFVTFPLKASREAPLAITWKDNRGGVFRQSADIKFS